MTAEAEHPDVHLSSAADDRDVRGRRAIDERATSIDELALPFEREKLLQVSCAVPDLHGSVRYHWLVE